MRSTERKSRTFSFDRKFHNEIKKMLPTLFMYIVNSTDDKEYKKVADGCYMYSGGETMKFTQKYAYIADALSFLLDPEDDAVFDKIYNEVVFTDKYGDKDIYSISPLDDDDTDLRSFVVRCASETKSAGTKSESEYIITPKNYQGDKVYTEWIIEYGTSETESKKPLF